MSDLHDEILSALSDVPRSISELNDVVAHASRRTLQRHLAALVDQGEVVAIGEGRGRSYQRARRTTHAVGWDPEFLARYQPNRTSYLSPTDLAELHAIGAPASTLPAGTYARRVLDRLLIDLSWSSSRLEGNTYSLLDTEELVLHGVAAEGKSTIDTQMVLNHKHAIEYLVSDIERLAIDELTIRNLHALLSQNLLASPRDSGVLRTSMVWISQSSYTPLNDPHRLAAAFTTLVTKLAAITDPFEASFFALVQLPYLQPFIDVNKRVVRLVANIPFIQNSLFPLSFLDTDRDAYLRATLAVYERLDLQPLRELFVEAYKHSAQKYTVVIQSLGEPDPFRLQYRLLIAEVVGDVVRDGASVAEAVSSVAAAVDEATRARLELVVREEFDALHEGNFARFWLRPSEFERWRAAKDKS